MSGRMTRPGEIVENRGKNWRIQMKKKKLKSGTKQNVSTSGLEG